MFVLHAKGQVVWRLRCCGWREGQDRTRQDLGTGNRRRSANEVGVVLGDLGGPDVFSTNLTDDVVGAVDRPTGACLLIRRRGDGPVAVARAFADKLACSMDFTAGCARRAAESFDRLVHACVV